MAAKTDRLMRLAGMLLLPAAVILQANAQQQNMQNMPGMQMSSGKADMKDDMQDLPTGPAVKLDDLEQMALSRNPTFSQVNADVRIAEASRSLPESDGRVLRR
jgi:cobalt-zinc-cadmium efflux system outer membrane protein